MRLYPDVIDRFIANIPVMPSPRWRPRRTPDGDVWVHDHHPGTRVQPGPHIDEHGRAWPHGVVVAELDGDGEWRVVAGRSWFWVHEAQEWVENLPDF